MAGFVLVKLKRSEKTENGTNRITLQCIIALIVLQNGTLN